MSKTRIAIVPAYNEEATVASVVGKVKELAPDYDVVVVDDGSTDKTSQEAIESGATVIKHPFNLGIGGAMQSGYRYALEHGYSHAVQVDGDGQHDPAQISDLSNAMDEEQGIDMVCGSRYVNGTTYKAPVTRRMGMLIFAKLLSPLVGQRVTDPTSGFRLVNRHGIELFARDYPHDYPEVEAIVMVHAHRLKMKEVPVSMSQREGGRSSITPTQSAYYMAKVLLAVIIGLFRARPSVEKGDEAPVKAEHGI